MDAVRARSTDRARDPDRRAMSPRGVIDVPSGPRQAARTGGSLGMILMPIAAGSGSLVLTITNQGRPLVAAIGLLILLASVGVGVVMVVTARTGARRTLGEQRERYLDVLDVMRARLHRARRDQVDSSVARHPPASALFDLARFAPPQRLRSAAGGSSAAPPSVLRIGLGPVPPQLAARRGAPGNVIEHAEDAVCSAAADDLIAAFGSIPDQPVLIRATPGTRITVTGPPGRVRAFARALVCRIAVDRPPGDVELLIACGGRTAQAWSWAAHLPHVVDHGAGTQSRSDRRIVDTGSAAAVLAARATTHPHAGDWIVVVDGGHAEQREIADAPDLVVLRLVRGSADDLPGADIRIELAPPTPVPDGLRDTVWDGASPTTGPAPFQADELDIATARSVARMLARNRSAMPPRPGTGRGPRSLPDALGVAPVSSWDVAASWRGRRPDDLLRVPIGVTDDGRQVLLDLKESARGGTGPHGLLVGATGTGKSELLRTLVVGLAATHPPDEIAFLLIDFKGGAAFAPLARLPQVAGVVTNLVAEDELIDRVRDALRGEIASRQRRLAGAGGLPDIDAYRRRAPEPGAEPMPRLMVIVDEFTELVTARPDMLDVFTAIGRIGRSLGIHLLIASQRLDAGRIRGLETHLSYRIALRTFSDLESREAIGRPDAFHLPDRPGSALLAAGGRLGPRFRGFSVSMRDAGGPTPADRASTVRILAPGAAGLGTRAATLRGRPTSGFQSAAGDPTAAEGAGAPSVLESMTSRIAIALPESGYAPARGIWLDPLPSRLPLVELLRLNPATPGAQIAALIGLVDDPERQRQEPLLWDPHEGPLLVVGAARSGRSAAAAAVIVSLAARHGPAAVEIYAVDAGGGGLARLDDLPHVASIAPRSDPELVRRTVAELRHLLDARDGPGAKHRVRAAVIVIDGWSAARQIEPALDEVLADLLARGPGLGMHTVVTVTSASELRPRLAAGFATRIELRLSDPFESAIDRTKSRRIRPGTPGRALVAGGRTAQLAVPPDDAREIGLLCGHGTEPVSRRIRLLPDRIDLDLVHRPPGFPTSVTLGIAERDMRPVVLDLAAGDPHLIVAGDPGSGRTAALRSIARQLAHERRAGEVDAAPDIFAIDFRRTLTGEPGIRDVAHAPAPAADLAAAIARRCAARLGRSSAGAARRHPAARGPCRRLRARHDGRQSAPGAAPAPAPRP